MNDREYESNSLKHRAEKEAKKEPEKRVEKVTVNAVKTKKNGVRKFTDVFISEDINNVKSYIFTDVLIPAFKKTISDVVTNGIDMILYGGNGRNRGQRNPIGSTVSYVSYYDRKNSPDPRNTQPKTGFSYDDLVFATRAEADAALDQMEEVIAKYGFVTVNDLYDMVELTAPYTSEKYGWVNLRNAEAVRARDGYILKLPKASPIER